MTEMIDQVFKFSPVVGVLLIIMYFQQRRINQLAAKVDELHKVIENLLVGKVDITKN